MSSSEPIGAPLERPADPLDEQVPGLSGAMFRYLLTVSILGPTLAIVLAVIGIANVGSGDVLAAVILTLLTAAAVRYPLQLRHRTMVYVAIVGQVAMILSLPVALPGVLALAARGLGRVGRRRDRFESAFDLGQVSLYVSACALFFWSVQDLAWMGPDFAGIGGIGAVVSTVVLAFGLNYGLVSIAAALHAGRNPVRVWLHNLRDDYQTEGTLAGIGVIGGVLAAHYPASLPLLVFPFLLLHRAMGSATRLRSDTFAALMKLNEIVELRDPYTAGHSVRVGEASRTIALRMNLTVEEAEEVGSAGAVHDVGKIGIDPAILSSPGRLTPPQMEQMKLHPGLGADIVSRFTTSGPITAYVRYHHESLDGTGYPEGLAGDEIPIGARIIAVADTFDALTSTRPYRDPLTATAALEVLRGGAGQQWDAAVVGAMLAVARSRGIPLPKLPEPAPRRGTEPSLV